MERYVWKNGKQLRYGYTTGSCAAGAAKAAVQMLCTGTVIADVDIDTPKGWRLSLEPTDVQLTPDWVRCAIEKDAGDDPDVTHGMRVYATAEWIAPSSEDQVTCAKTEDTPSVWLSENILLIGGSGVGRVTKPGLSVPVGEPAINPVPREMIRTEIEAVLPVGKRVAIRIDVPDGATRAAKTFNPRLGVVGGISIIGTSGIVEPMSEEALQASLKLEISMHRAQGRDTLLFAPGNYGRDFALGIGLSAEPLVKTSNFIGFMIDESAREGVRQVLWVGHIGKLVKVAAGIFHTHSKMADGRMETLAAHVALMGAQTPVIEQIMQANTTDEAVEIILREGYGQVFDHLAEAVSQKCIQRSFQDVHFGTILFNHVQGELGRCSHANALVEQLRSEGGHRDNRAVGDTETIEGGSQDGKG